MRSNQDGEHAPDQSSHSGVARQLENAGLFIPANEFTPDQMQALGTVASRMSGEIIGFSRKEVLGLTFLTYCLKRQGIAFRYQSVGQQMVDEWSLRQPAPENGEGKQ